MNTICCTSKISYIDGDLGILEYRGYPIEVLAAKATFLETAFLLIYGELPTQPQLSTWQGKIISHTTIHKDLNGIMANFRHDAHPMGMMVGSLAAMSTLYPE